MHGSRAGKADPVLSAMMTGATDRPLRHVLIAVDLSPESQRVIRRATLLPLAADASLEILNVVPAGMPKKAASAALRSSEEKLRRLQLAATLPVTFKTVVGQPHVEIIRRSRALGADLVVIGRAARKGRGVRTVIGSTPKRVIRKGDVPVLVVTLDPAGPYERPLVAVDLSDTSRRVVDLARRVLGPEGCRRLSLVHAYHVPFEGWVREDGSGREFKESATARLQSFHRALGDEAGLWRPVLRKGDPAVVILAEADRRRADLIVLGTHGRAGVTHALLGSVAEWLVSEATCDVAITRPIRYSFELP